MHTSNQCTMKITSSCSAGYHFMATSRTQTHTYNHTDTGPQHTGQQHTATGLKDATALELRPPKDHDYPDSQLSCALDLSLREGLTVWLAISSTQLTSTLPSTIRQFLARCKPTSDKPRPVNIMVRIVKEFVPQIEQYMYMHCIIELILLLCAVQ